MWLTEFREANGLSIEDLGAEVRMAGKKLSPPVWIRDSTLIALETQPGYLVIPAFANLIAEVCGATAEQRDALTLPKHAGTWKPKGGAKAVRTRSSATESPWRRLPAVPGRRGGEQGAGKLPVAATNRLARALRPAEPPRVSNRGRPVVRVNGDGQVLATYRGPNHAANHCGVDHGMVLRRCMRAMKSNEFTGLGYTFRFQDEWVRMTKVERREDLDRARLWRGNPGAHRIHTQKTRKGHHRRAVVVIDREGRETRRYSSAREAAEAMGVPYGTVVAHCILKHGFTSHYTREGTGFVYADQWDAMDESAREAVARKQTRLQPAQAGGK